MSRRRSSLGATSVASGMNSDSNSTANVPPSSDSIKVICRFRPPSQNRDSLKPSKGYNNLDAYKIDEDRNEVEFTSDFSEGKGFTFDKVFGTESTQSQIFQEVGGVVHSVMDGFNGTIMAYGQTSAGKSYTMEGLSLWDPHSQGVIPRCVDALFEEINKADSVIQFQVVLSFYEIYCEKIRDLLNPAQVNLKIRETKNSGFIVQDITEVYCTDRESVLRVIEVGKANRVTAPTLMNAESSRSHSIVSILIDQKNLSTGRNKRGVLFLVDLAGSEKVSKTGASGMRLEEAKNINSSLTTLGMVINALCDGSPHVPYRDSKLTMILTDALGGNSKTTLIICCTPDIRHIPETVSTLRFGERAKRIKNNARVNEEFSVDELKNMLVNARKEIQTLKNRLRLSELPLPPDMHSQLDSQDDDYESNRSMKMAAQEPELSASRDEEQKLEIESLRARIISLEEELDVERMRNKEEHEQRLLIASEAEALKHTITELEEKMLKTALSTKRHHASFDGSRRPSMSIDAEDPPHLALDKKKHKSPHDSPTFGSSDSHHQHHHQHGKNRVNSDSLEEEIAKMLESREKKGKFLEKTPEKGEDEDEDDDDDDDDSEAFEIIENRHNRGNSIHELNKHGLFLNAQLESEIKGLAKSVSEQEAETRNAQANAENFAEKYLKLREEYELHVQRLMLKLTQEQQARTIIEDKLEDAYLKLWKENRKKRKSKGFFAKWFGYNEPKTPGDVSPSSGRPHEGSIQNMSGFNEREQNLSRSLDLAQSRVSQLVSELEATKEAQMIVLETKEAVMRSLARQNSQLTIERDSLNRRVEELNSTVEQLTTLLRNVQQRSMRDHGRQHPNNTIKGGHHHKHKEQRDPNPETNFEKSISTEEDGARTNSVDMVL